MEKFSQEKFDKCSECKAEIELGGSDAYWFSEYQMCEDCTDREATLWDEHYASLNAAYIGWHTAQWR